MKKMISFLLVQNILMLSALAQVAVNQIGYLPESEKFVYFQNHTTSFLIVDLKTDASVFEGKATLWVRDDPATGHTVYKGDFSRFQSPGTYKIQSESGETSCSFSIGNAIYDELYKESLKTFYIQRCGMELEKKVAGEFAHAACHGDEAIYHRDTGKEGMREVSGGWHDAGDYGRYMVNGAYSVAVMLSGYEHFPHGFQEDQIHIPESGNGVPDILDEIRYELEWMLKMQDDDGGLFHKVTEQAFQTLDLRPHLDEKPRYITIKSTAATADFIIAMAQASRIYDSIDASFAARCKAAALNAWDYLEAHPSIVPEGGFTNPADIHTGQYDDRDDRDERLWAAVEMVRTFEDEKYNRFFKDHIRDVEHFPSEIAWRDLAPFAIVNYLKFAGDAGNREMKAYLSSSLKTFCDKMVSRRNRDGYHALLVPGDYRWGSLQIDLNFGFILLAGGYIFDNEEYKSAAIDQINFILGANGLQLSFVTGFGENASANVHNRICSLTKDWEIYPGFLVGGPNENLEDPLLKEMFEGNTTPGLCYLDARDSYASNETCINWNAILVVYAGHLKGLQK